MKNRREFEQLVDECMETRLQMLDNIEKFRFYVPLRDDVQFLVDDSGCVGYKKIGNIPSSRQKDFKLLISQMKLGEYKRIYTKLKENILSDSKHAVEKQEYLIKKSMQLKYDYFKKAEHQIQNNKYLRDSIQKLDPIDPSCLDNLPDCVATKKATLVLIYNMTKLEIEKLNEMQNEQACALS